MVSSQKTEDDSQRAAAGGVPGTAANLPHPPDKAPTGTGSSHRTENVTYQSSRVVKHTRIPQGVIRRMSLSVLVGQQTHFEGQGKARHSVTVPPSPETLKTIRDLVAGVTGFNMDRGDQLIVETLPFESLVDADFVRQAPAPPRHRARSGSTWLQNTVTPFSSPSRASLFSWFVSAPASKWSRQAAAARPAELDPTLAVASGAGAYGAIKDSAADRADISTGGHKDLLLDTHDATADRIRELAQRDLNATANVLRMWMQKQKA